MSCPSCGATNPAGKRFCGDCGTALAVACPACGAQVEPGKRFCGDCGTALDTGGPGGAASAAGTGVAHVAERRVVSVLFLDLVGFTTFSEGRDSETVRELLTEYFGVARDIVGRYGGTIEKFIGDAVMAVWGAPVAREDDAERAVRAALDLVAAVPSLGEGIRARGGVLTGEAAVTMGAVNEGMVAGDMVNTAARIQSVAEPGSVLVGEATMQAASAAIAFEPAGEHELKGKSASIRTWRALRVVAQRGGVGRSELPEPPFTGRDIELQALRTALESVARDGRATLVSITGPAGIGKSRLTWELEKYVDGLAGTYLWHRGRSPSYGDGLAFWALGEMVRRRAGLVEEDDAAETRRKVREVVDRYVLEETDRRWAEPALLTLLGVDAAPPGGREALFAGWRTFFERLADVAPVVLVFEDLQWADTGLLDFIEHLLEWSRNAPILVVALARPELAERRPDWGATTRTLVRLVLDPLPRPAMLQLLDGFVPGLPSDAAEAIVARAEGVPLYAVEFARSLVVEGRLERVGDTYRPAGSLAQLSIPPTLRSLITSRLDALAPPDRSLVSDAAVLGHAWTLDALAAVSGEAPEALDRRLRGLVRRELIEVDTDPRSPEVGQHRFVQALIGEVAYATLARRDRRVRHVAAARYFEQLDDPEIAGVIATHYVAAHAASDPGPEADELAVHARLGLEQAATRAMDVGSPEQALRYRVAALDLAAVPAERVVLLRGAAKAAAVAARYDEAEARARQAIDEAEAAGLPDAILAHVDLGEVLLDAGRPGDAAEVLEPLAPRFDDTTTMAWRAHFLQLLSRVLMRLGRYGESIARADECLAIAEPANLLHTVADALNNKGTSLGSVERIREGVALLNLAASIAHDRGFVSSEARALSNLAAVSTNLVVTLPAVEAARGLALRLGNRTLLAFSSANHDFARYIACRDWDELISQARADPGREPGQPDVDRALRLLIVGLVLIAVDGHAPAALAEARTIVVPNDQQVMSTPLTLEAEEALAAGDAARAAEIVPALEPGVPRYGGNDLVGTVAQIELRDPVGIRAAADSMTRVGLGDPILLALHTALVAAADALDGITPDPKVGLAAAMETANRAGARLVAARLVLAMTVAMGGARGFETEAAWTRALFEEIGATALLRRLDAALGTDASSPPLRPAGALPAAE